jgi:O-antigen/teichoic acid export membrane protein
MTYLFAVFTAVRGMLDLGSSTAFFTLISQRPRSRQFVLNFWRFTLLQLVMALLFLLLLLPSSFVSTLWGNESRALLSLAFLAAFMQGTVWTLAVQMAEASRQTIRAQQVNTYVVLLHFAVMFALAHYGKMSVGLIFVALSVEWLAAALLVSRLYAFPAASEAECHAKDDSLKRVWMEVLIYCSPLIVPMFLGFVHDFMDRWMLQAWSGASEQAYFSVAQQYSAVALLATISLLRILWKEIAEACHQKDMDRVKHLYHRASCQLLFVSAYFSGLLQPVTHDLLSLSVGKAYLSGTVAMAIMFLYPVHQSLGQISATMLYATGHTKAYAVCSSVGMLCSLVIAYFMLAPVNAIVPGFHLGAEGLALKLVCAQIFSVNLMCYMIARVFKWRFEWLYQLCALAGCTGLGWAAHYIIVNIFGPEGKLLFIIPLYAALYSLLVGLYVYCLPWLLAMTKAEMISHLKHVLKLR